MGKLPATKIEISNVAASDVESETRLLLIGIKTSDGLATANTAIKVLSNAQAEEQFGRGSQLHGMVVATRGVNSRLDIWAVPVAEPGGGVAATGTIVIAGTTTTARPLVLRIEDRRVEVALAIGDDDEAVAAKVEAELDKDDYADLHVTASVSVATVTLTARSKGLHGNDVSIKKIDVPPGITATVTAMASGASASSLTTAISSLGGVRYTHIVVPQRDTTTLGDVQELLDARWAKELAIDGHAFASGGLASVSTVVTLADGLDDKHLTIVAEPLCPTPSWKQAAILAATRASESNPNKSLRNVPLVGILPPDQPDRIDDDDREALLEVGVSPMRFVGNKVYVARTVTLAKTNDLGQPSTALFDLETKLTVSAVRQAQLALLNPLLGRILVEDAAAADYNLGVEVIDAEGVRVLLLRQYKDEFIPAGWVDRYDDFADALEVEKTGADEVSYVWPGYIAGHLYNIPGSLQFRLA